MGIQVDWDHSGQMPEQTIIYWMFEGEWDWNDFSQADRQAYEMALSMPHTVHSIVDFRASPHIPRRGAISYFTRSVTKAPPNRGLVVIVGAPRMARALEDVLRTLAPQASSHYKLANSIDNAYQMIQGVHVR